MDDKFGICVPYIPLEMMMLTRIENMNVIKRSGEGNEKRVESIFVY